MTSRSLRSYITSCTGECVSLRCGAVRRGAVRRVVARGGAACLFEDADLLVDGVALALQVRQCAPRRAPRRDLLEKRVVLLLSPRPALSAPSPPPPPHAPRRAAPQLCAVPRGAKRGPAGPAAPAPDPASPPRAGPPWPPSPPRCTYAPSGVRRARAAGRARGGRGAGEAGTSERESARGAPWRCTFAASSPGRAPRPSSPPRPPPS